MAFLPVARYAGTHLMISVTANNAAGRIAIFVEQDPRAPAENHLEKTARDGSPTRPYAAEVEKARDRKFADSPLEEAVSSEPVSKVGVLGAEELRHDSEAIMDHHKAEKGHFGLE
jgi:hypothetical protein